MIGQFRLQRSLQDCFGELFQQAVLADDVFRLLVIGQQLINEGLVDSHRFLILLFRWSFTQFLLRPLRWARRKPRPITPGGKRTAPVLDSTIEGQCLSQKAPLPFGSPNPLGPSYPVLAVQRYDPPLVPLLREVTSNQADLCEYGDEPSIVLVACQS